MPRIEDLKNDPYKFDQGSHGFCGFASVIMSLLEHDVGNFDNLCKCVFNGTGTYLGFSGGTIRIRTQKRVNLGLIIPETDHPHLEDVQLGIGLIISFKEKLKSSRLVSMWNECKTFSSNFIHPTGTPWRYAPDGSGGQIKLKNITKSTVPADLLDFSYKRGDLALYPDSCSKLISYVYGNKIRGVNTRVLTDPNTYHPGTKFSNLPIPTSQEIIELKTHLRSRGAGAIVGVAVNTKNPAKRFVPEKYSYVVHWVYVSRKENDTNPTELTAWTWGQKFNLIRGDSGRDGLFADCGLVPMVAPEFNVT